MNELLVIIPVYNAIPYIKSAVESVFQQSYDNYTLLIIDDGSNDGTLEYLKSINFRKFELLQEFRKGPGFLMNIAIDFASMKGIPFICRMDAVDVSEPNRFLEQVNFMKRNPQFAASSSNCLYIDTEDQVIGNSTVPLMSKLILNDIRLGLRGLIQGACIFRTENLIQIGGYNSNFPQAEDTDLFLRLSERYPLANLSDYLYRIRIHSESLSVKNLQENIRYHFYALESQKIRERKLPTISFDEFESNMGLANKIFYWQELIFLSLWRKGMRRSNVIFKILAGLISPKRIISRFYRMIERFTT